MKRLTLIVCIAVLVATLGAVVGCGGDGGGDGDTPSQVVEKYLEASFNLDVDTAYDLLSSADKQNVSKEEMQEMAGSTALEGFEYDYEIVEETIEGDTATVSVKVSIGDPESGQSEEFEDVINLVKEDGKWKISIVGSVPDTVPSE